jgi:integrase
LSEPGKRPQCPWPSLVLDDWPARDQDAWAVATAPPSPFEPDVGYANRWRPTTLRVVKSAYARWLGWLRSKELLDFRAAPGERVSPEVAEAYFRDLVGAGLADYTVSNALQHLADALRAMSPREDWTWLQTAASRQHSRAKRRTDIRARLQPVENVLQLGFDLMDRAERGDVPAVRDVAVQYRDGLMVALQTYRAFRLANLSQIQIGRELRRRGAIWVVEFSTDQMKGKRPHKVTWPTSLNDPLQRYLDHYRPQLLGEHAARRSLSGPLWVSRGGAAMTASVLTYRVGLRTREHFGATLNTHAFRHVAATVIAEDDPDGVAAVAGLLAHSTLETSEKYYIQASQIAAGARYQAVIAKARGQRAPGRPRSDRANG